MKVKLVEVQGDQEEFADLIGCCGSLSENCFSAEGNEWLRFKAKSREEIDDKIVIHTMLGNAFVFRRQ